MCRNNFNTIAFIHSSQTKTTITIMEKNIFQLFKHKFKNSIFVKIQIIQKTTATTTTATATRIILKIINKRIEFYELK